MVLTRAPEDNARLRSALGPIEAEVVDYSCIAIEGVPVEDGVVGRLRKAYYSAVVFVSRNAADHFFSSVRLAAPSEVVAIGPATAEAILRHGWPVSAVPPAANVASAIEEMDRLVRSAGPVLYVRGDLGEDTLPEALRERGKVVEVAVVYATKKVDASPLPPTAVPTLLTFASPSAVRHFVERNPGVKFPTLAIGETTAGAAREQGFEVTVAPSPDLHAMAVAIHQWADHQL